MQVVICQLRHAAASEAMLRFEEARFDMCRLGIGLYGFSVTAGEELEPVSTLRTRIVQIRNISKGDTIGNGRDGKVEKDFFGRVSTPFEVITRKAVTPCSEELERNPRSRSAKLRAAIKL